MNEELLKEILEDFMSKLKVVLEGAVSEPATATSGVLSKRTLLELVGHEGIVLEAYKDSKGIWTWGIGVTNASGHRVARYKDKPQSIQKVVEIFEWLVRTKYLPDVLKAFEGHTLTEAQQAAALSFHYNTGAIGKASWVKSFKAGNIEKAKLEFMNYKKPKEIIPRREAERDLFFDGVWSEVDGKATVYKRVKKPSYSPDWGSAEQVDISKEFS